MKKIILLTLSSIGLLSCSFNTLNPINKLGNSELCEKNNSENKIEKISVPDSVGNTPPPDKDNFIKIESSVPVSPSTSLLKEDKFVAVYNYSYSNQVVGKIFDKDGKEIISRFEVLEVPKNKQVKFKIITDKKLDYFLIFYSFSNIYTSPDNTQNDFFLKRFDLEGNQIGNEIKLESRSQRNNYTDINYSFDSDGKNLILSWTTLIINPTEQSKHTCTGICPAIVGPNYYNPMVNILTFDDKFNYCYKKAFFDDLIVLSTSANDFSKPYINKNREKIILPLDNNTLKEINLKDLKTKNKKLKINVLNKDLNRTTNFVQDNDGNYYFIEPSTPLHLYKTDNNFNLIKENNLDIKDIPDLDLSKIDDKIQIASKLFIDAELNTFKYNKIKYIDLNPQTYIQKIGNNILVIEDNYFSLIKI